MEPLVILIDGYNVIRKTPGLLAAERVSLAAGREALLDRVVARYRHTPHRVVVVFDGDGASESVAALPRRTHGQVIFAARGVTADAVIARLAAAEQACGARTLVVSEDFEVRQGATLGGALTARPAELTQRLNQPPRDVRQRGQHRAALRAQWEGEANDADAGQRQRGKNGKPGNPRRAPRKRRAAETPW